MIYRYLFNADVRDPDAELLIDRIISDGGTLTANEKKAWRTLVKNGKLHEWYYCCLAIYPLIGGTLDSCKYNGIRPEDNDLAFRLTYTGTPSVSANGLSFDGSAAQGLCKTQIVPQGQGMSYTDAGGLLFYSRTNNVASEYSAGCYGATYGIWLAPKNGSGYCNAGSSYKSFTAQDISGIHYVNREPYSSRMFYYRNTTKVYDNSACTFSGYFGGIKTGTMICFGGTMEGAATYYYSKQEYAFFAVTLWITEAQYLLMLADIQEFQTLIGRQITLT